MPPDRPTTPAVARPRPIDRRVAAARDLIAAGRFDEAESRMREPETGPDGALLLARCYRECLRAAATTGAPRALVDAMLQRAVASAVAVWTQAGAGRDAAEAASLRAQEREKLVRIAAGAGRWAPGGAA